MNGIVLYQEMKSIIKDAFYIILQKLGVVLRSIGLTWMLAQLGRQALAAGALVLTGFSIGTYLLMGALASISICAAHAKGSGKKEELATYFRNGFLFAILLSVPLILILLFTGPILSLFGQSPDVIPIAAHYAHFLAWAILPFAIFVVFQQFLLSLSKFKLVMFSSLLGIFIILIMSYLLAFGKFGLPHLGIAGLGLGAIISFISVSIYLFLLLAFDKGFQSYQLFKNFWKFDRHFLNELWQIGWPLGGKWAIEAGIFLIIAMLIGHRNINELAAQQILFQFVLFSGMFAAGIDQATMIRTSQAAGNKEINKIKLIAKSGLFLGLIFAAIVSIILLLFATQILTIFFVKNTSSLGQVIGITLAMIPLVIVYQLLDSVRTIATGILAAFKDTKFPFLIEVISFWIVGLLIGYFLVSHLSPILSYWIGLIIGISFCSICLIFRIKNFIKSKAYTSSRFNPSTL